MIIKFNKKFNNAYESEQIRTKDNCVDDMSWQNICDEYFNMDIIKNNNINDILNKFKNICYFNFFSNLNFDISNTNYYDYNYIVNCIKKDINKYIVSDSVKFTDIFYHFLNNCIIYKNEIKNYVDDSYCFTNNDYQSIFMYLKYKDIKDDIDFINCANVFFKYNYNGKDGVILVCFLISKNSRRNKIIPKFMNIKIEDFDKFKTNVLKFLENHKDLQNISSLKEFQFGS